MPLQTERDTCRGESTSAKLHAVSQARKPLDEVNMKNMAFSILAPAALLLLLCVYTAGQTATSPQQPPIPAPSLPVASGTITDSTYKNDYFGMRLIIPAGWTVYDAQGRRILIEQGRQQFTNNEKSVQAQLDAGISRTVNLLTISKPAEDDSGIENAIFICGAEFVPRTASSAAATSQDYLIQVKRLLGYTKIPYKLEDPVSSEKINGIDFAVLIVSSESPRGEVRQKYHAIMKKGYAIFFISTYINEVDLAVMHKLMSSIKFE
jgi:hypothetical protein